MGMSPLRVAAPAGVCPKPQLAAMDFDADQDLIGFNDFTRLIVKPVSRMDRDLSPARNVPTLACSGKGTVAVVASAMLAFRSPVRTGSIRAGMA
jgi:hypothetical protein